MKVAVLGGGQLGRMLGLAGIPLGVEFRFLDPVAGAPAAAVGPLTVAALGDVAAIGGLAAGCDAITYEWEGVPADAVRAAALGPRLAPPLAALEVSQDRLAEKELCRELGIATAPFANVETATDLHDAAAYLGLPAIVKTRRGGYDGKGQVRVRDAAQLDATWTTLSAQAPLIFERVVEFDRELSVLACRSRSGDSRTWPLAENVHVDGILHTTIVRRGRDASADAAATDIADAIMRHLDYVGVLCVELFDVGSQLLVNELAPRVHNSGHWTIEGAVTSQFENHIRAILDLPLGDTALVHERAAMVNCIGAMPDRAAVLAIGGAHLHDYGKAPRAGRKVGHITATAASDSELDTRLAALEALTGPPPSP